MPVRTRNMTEIYLHKVFGVVLGATDHYTATENFDPADLARLALVNKQFRWEIGADRHWGLSSRTWSPEYCGPVKTLGNKHFRTLAQRWWGRDAGGATTFRFAHTDEEAEEEPCGVLAVQISPDDPLTAFSIGLDESLVCTDLTTPQIRASLVCTGGEDHFVKVWDVNQLGNAPNQQPAFNINVFREGGHSEDCDGVWSMMPAGQPAGHQFTQLLTGGSDSKVCLWDVRNPTGPPVCSYMGGFNFGSVASLAIDPARRILYGGCYRHAIACWDMDSGALKARLPCPKEHVRTVVVGKDCLVALAYHNDEGRENEEGIGGAWEWGHPGHQPVPGNIPHRATLTLNHIDAAAEAEAEAETEAEAEAEPEPEAEAEADAGAEAWPTCILGLGEGPEMLLAGTRDGRIRLMEREGHSVRNNWALGGQPYPNVPVTAMAATDNVLVAGYRNGALAVFPMNTPY